MIRILQPRKTWKAPLLALGLGVCAYAPFLNIPAHADDMYRASPGSVSVFTSNLPSEITQSSRLSGLSVIDIERLNALEADIVHIQLGEDQGPQMAVQILNSKFPAAEFELFGDLDLVEAGAGDDELAADELVFE